MSNLKKFKIIISVIMMLLILLSGCASTGSTINGNGNAAESNSTESAGSITDTDSSSGSDNTSPDAATSLAPVDLTWYFTGTGQQPDVGLIEKAADEYLKDKINVKLHLVCYDYTTYESNLDARLNSGDAGDMVFTSVWACNYPYNASKNLFTDLTPMLDKYAPKTKSLLGENVLKGATVNGKIYALPSLGKMSHNWILCYNKDLVEKYNLDMSKIKTLADLEPYMETISENEPDIHPLEATIDESPYRSLDFEKICDDQTPGAIYGSYKNTKVVNDFDTPEAKAFYALMRKYYLAGYIRNDADSVTDSTIDEKAGKIAFHIKSGSPVKAEELSLAQGIRWGQIDLTAPVATTREMEASMQAIPKSSKNPERALMFLELLNTDKFLNNLINFGIEGKHYVKIDESTISLIPGKENGVNSGYFPNTPAFFGNQFLNYLLKNEDPKKWELMGKFNAAAKQSPLLGFTFDKEPVKTELTALAGVKRQYFPLLETGKGDPASVLPTMDSRMKSVGLDKVLAEMKKQVDAFVARKD